MTELDTMTDVAEQDQTEDYIEEGPERDAANAEFEAEEAAHPDNRTTCNICGRVLTANVSVVRGIGPVCIARFMTYHQIADYDTFLGLAQKASHEDWAGQVGAVRDAVRAGVDILTDVPEGYVKLAEVAVECHRREIPGSRMIRAFGGDRGLYEPLLPEFVPAYVGRVRYLPEAAMTTGLDKLTDEGGWADIRPARKPRAERSNEVVKVTELDPAESGSDVNTGPTKVKRGRKAKEVATA